MGFKLAMTIAVVLGIGGNALLVADVYPLGAFVVLGAFGVIAVSMLWLA